MALSLRVIIFPEKSRIIGRHRSRRFGSNCHVAVAINLQQINNFKNSENDAMRYIVKDPRTPITKFESAYLVSTQSLIQNCNEIFVLLLMMMMMMMTMVMLISEIEIVQRLLRGYKKYEPPRRGMLIILCGTIYMMAQ